MKSSTLETLTNRAFSADGGVSESGGKTFIQCSCVQIMGNLALLDLLLSFKNLYSMGGQVLGMLPENLVPFALCPLPYLEQEVYSQEP